MTIVSELLYEDLLDQLHITMEDLQESDKKAITALVELWIEYPDVAKDLEHLVFMGIKASCESRRS